MYLKQVIAVTGREKMAKKYIDADEFKKENERLLHCDFPYLSEETLEELIDNMPAADIPRWIPVTERLPEESGEYLVAIGSMLYFSWFYKNDGVWSFMNADITAWMPLPEPYKGCEEK